MVTLRLRANIHRHNWTSCMSSLHGRPHEPLLDISPAHLLLVAAALTAAPLFLASVGVYQTHTVVSVLLLRSSGSWKGL
jgi:hypothetical protein